MNCTEREDFYQLREKLIRTVNPIAIAATLYQHNDCDRQLYNKILAKSDEGSSRDEIWNTLLPSIAPFRSIPSLCLALYRSGYEMISVELLLLRFLNYSNAKIIPGPGRAECNEQDYFLLLKASFHDQVFKEPHELLEKTMQRHKTKYRLSFHEEEKMDLADHYADCLCVIIDTKAMDFIGKFPNHKLFDDLKAIIPATSNTLLTEVAYYSRLAIAHGMAKQIEKGRRCMTKAQVAAFQIEQDVQYVYNMLYIHIHFLCMQEAVPGPADIEGVIDVANRFLYSIPHDDKGAVFWKKMVVLRVACLLLGISHEGCINERQKIEREHVDKAKTFLKVIKAHWDGIEYIRRLFYVVCRARIREIEFQQRREGQDEKAFGKLSKAIGKLRNTVEEDKDRTFRETTYAKYYIKRLCNLIGNV